MYILKLYLFKSTQKTLNTQFEIEMLHMKQKPYLQFTALHQLNNVIEEHISVPFTKSTHIIWNLQEKTSNITCISLLWVVTELLCIKQYSI